MMDEMEPKKKPWKPFPADLDPAVASGADLLNRLKESGTGEEKLAVGLSVFPTDDETGEATADVPAVEVAKVMCKADPSVVPDVTKDKVWQFLTAGSYTPPVEKKSSVADRLMKVKPIEKAAKAAKADPKKADAK